MKDSTREEWQLLSRHHEQWLASLPDRVLAHLSLLGGEYGGFAVDRLTHSLQTATRAQRDGRDDEYVVCALLHDIGDPLAPENHPDVAAAILRAYVSPENLFMVEKHDVFQGYYFWHHLDDDRNARERFRGHPFFEHTAEFCELYDQSSFDPDYESLPLAHFEPLVRALLAKPRFRFFQKTPDTPAEAGRD
jgi:predicted HD phosphohydrolase